MSGDETETPHTKETNKRLWQALDNINSRLKGIEGQLSDVVRLEERMNNHDSALSRYGSRLDKLDTVVHNLELWQAGHGDKGSYEKTISKLETEISLLKDKDNIDKGQKDIVRWVLGIAVAVLSGILVYKLTRG